MESKIRAIFLECASRKESDKTPALYSGVAAVSATVVVVPSFGVVPPDEEALSLEDAVALPLLVRALEVGWSEVEDTRARLEAARDTATVAVRKQLRSGDSFESLKNPGRTEG